MVAASPEIPETQRTGAALDRARRDVAAAKANVASLLSKREAVKAAIEGASDRVTVEALAKHCESETLIEAEIKSADAALYAAAAAESRAAIAHDLATARATALDLEARSKSIAERIRREYPNAASRIVGVIASYKQLVDMVAKANARQNVSTLRPRGYLLTPAFLSELKLPRLIEPGYHWFPGYDLAVLDKIERCAAVPLDAIGLDGRVDTLDHFISVRDKLRSAEARFFTLYDTSVAKILELLDAEWTVRRDVEAFNASNSAPRSRKVEAPASFLDTRAYNIAGLICLPRLASLEAWWLPHWDCGRLATQRGL
jgi:hypothetical protein